MSDLGLGKKKADALWIAHGLFERGKVTGSTANLSFLHGGKMYISATGSCFGTLSVDDFAVLDSEGAFLGGARPSKEYPLHLAMYKSNKELQAVIHTHSFYATLWSCCCNEADNAVPRYTPYLTMKLGNIGLVPYAPPGSEQLFSLFRQGMDGRKGYLLRNHGPVVGDTSLMAAFYGLEELEESAKIAWELRKEGAVEI